MTPEQAAHDDVLALCRKTPAGGWVMREAPGNVENGYAWPERFRVLNLSPGGGFRLSVRSLRVGKPGLRFWRSCRGWTDGLRGWALSPPLTIACRGLSRLLIPWSEARWELDH